MPLPIRRFVAMAAWAAGILGIIAAAPTTVEGDQPEKEGITLVVDFNDGSQLRYTGLDWNDKMTALGALKVAAKHRRGFEYKVRGSGSIAFVTEIAGEANEGADGRNWLFKINGKLAKVGAGSQLLDQGDRVEWVFVRYDDLP